MIETYDYVDETIHLNSVDAVKRNCFLNDIAPLFTYESVSCAKHV